jgi:hypothetical protein
MGHRYSLDLRVRAADFVEASHFYRAAAWSSGVATALP